MSEQPQGRQSPYEGGADSHPRRHRVRVAELSPNDVLPATGARVVGRPSAGIKTPKGCVDVLVRYPRQSDYEPPVLRTWRMDSYITVEREE